MKTKYKIFFAKIISKIIIFIINKKFLFVKRNKINWKLDLNEGIDLSIFIFNNFEKSILKNAKKLNTNKNLDIIDIGANMGVHSLNFASTFKKSKIYSIEPTNYAFNKFLENLKINPSIKNIKPLQLFLTNSMSRPKKIYSSWDLLSKGIKHKKHMGILKSISNSKHCTFDDFIKKYNLNKKTLIKCDVDGNELSVFKSAETYLKKYKPIIIMELAPYLYPEHGYDYKILLEYLKKI